MDDQFVGLKPHALCVPFPAQGHIKPMLKLAKLLHLKGFHITFVHTEFNHSRLIRSNGPDSVKGSPGFRFETIPDGLPESSPRGILDLPELCTAMEFHGRRSFRGLVTRLMAKGSSPESPPVSCVVSDGVMGFTVDAAEEFGIPAMFLFTPSGCGMLGYLDYQDLVERGYFPLKDESYLSNGYLNTVLEWIPAMKGIRLRDLPTFLRSTDPNDTMFNYNLKMIKNAKRAKAIILNTFDELEQQVLHAIKTNPNDYFPKQLYTIGPLPLLLNQQVTETSPNNNSLESIESSLWKEDVACLDWLDKQNPNSVLYVNFGSLVTLTPKQLGEFVWGLKNSQKPFLWVIRADLLIEGGDEIIPDHKINGRGLILDWCPQERVLRHPSVGGFLTHCGWNSTLECLSSGVPMICWPFFADQQANCFYCCRDWGVGSEIGEDVERGKVEEVVRELMEGEERGKRMRERAEEWKSKADVAVGRGGSSYGNFEKLVEQLKEESISFRKKKNGHCN